MSEKITWLDINSSYSHSSAALPIIEAQQPSHQRKYQWGVVKATLKSDIKDIVVEVVSQNPSVIAYTSWLFTCELLNQVLARVKALLPEVVIVGGGHEYLGDNREFLNSTKYVDFVVRGEGEDSFYELMEYVFSPRKERCTVTGGCYVAPSGEYVDNAIARVANFAELELPETSQFFDWNKPFIQLETTRGCFNSCAFCVSGNDKPLRSQSVEQIRRRVLNLHQRGITDVRVLDRTFNSNPRRAIELLCLFGEYSAMNFHIEIHPALLTDDVLKAISLLPQGVLHIEAGIQSLDDSVLLASGRRGETESALNGLSRLCDLPNVETHADLIAGLPLYTLTQIYDDVMTLARIGAGEIQLESLKLLPGTAMKANAKRLGMYYSPLPPYEILATEHISMQQLSEAMVLSRVLDFYYNNSAWNIIFRRLICEQKSFLGRLINFFIDLNCWSQPLSQEKQGLILHEFLEQNYADYLIPFRVEWIRNGLSLRKSPTAGISSSPIVIDTSVDIIFGSFTTEMRVYHFSENGVEYIFGFNRGKEHSKPLFFGTRNRPQ